MSKIYIIILSILLNSIPVLGGEWSSLIANIAAIEVIKITEPPPKPVPPPTPDGDSVPVVKTDENYTILSFTATWCSPCKQMKATWISDEVVQYLNNNTKVDAGFDFYYKIDADSQPDWVTGWKVESLPTVVIAKWDKTTDKWKEVDRLVGYANSEKLLKFFNKNIK